MVKNKRLMTLLGVAGLAGLVANSASAITVDANDVVLTETGSNTISVTNVESTDSFKACKIIDVKYDEDTNEVSYDFTAAFDAFRASTAGASYADLTEAQYQELTGSSITSGALTGATGLDALAGIYANYLRTNGTSGCSDMTISGTTASLTATTAGGYLILPVSSTKVYSAMIANIGVDDELEPDTSSASVVAKKGEPGSILKSANGDTFAIGAPIDYTLTISIPEYPDNAVNTEFTIVDTLPENVLTLDTTSIPTITDGNNTSFTVANDGTITSGTTTIGQITYTATGLTLVLNSTKDLTGPITLGYQASITSSALAAEALINTAVLDYPKDVYDSNSATNEVSVSDTVKTLGIKIKKIDNLTPSTALSGAEFKIYYDSTLLNEVTCYTDVTGTSTNSSTVVVDDSLGESTAGFCRGIPAGTYYIKETKAPTGYKLLTDAVAVTISETNATYGLVATGSTVTTGYYQHTSINEKASFILPFTGGRGVIVYAVIGVTIVTVASAIYTRKKKDDVQE